MELHILHMYPDVLNLYGDVMYVGDASGNIKARYAYDAWGNILESTGDLAEINPLRYRGYEYDGETGFYYLHGRYYDPANKRFLNADINMGLSVKDIRMNMYAYCGNNPLKNIDENGEDAILLYDDEGFGHIGALIQDEEGNWWHFYWGAKHFNNNFIHYLFNPEDEPLKDLSKYSGEITLEAINAGIPYKGNYDRMIYCHGDFSASYEYAKDLERDYHLYEYNCGQATNNVLSQSDTAYRENFRQNEYKLFLFSMMNNFKILPTTHPAGGNMYITIN